MKKRYQDILDKPTTSNWNEIDKARDLLREMLDDDELNLTSEQGDIISTAASLIN